jgi:hypothetical protein
VLLLSSAAVNIKFSCYTFNKHQQSSKVKSRFLFGFKGNLGLEQRFAHGVSINNMAAKSTELFERRVGLLDCGGNRKTPLSCGRGSSMFSTRLARAKAVSPLRSATAVQNHLI